MQLRKAVPTELKPVANDQKVLTTTWDTHRRMWGRLFLSASQPCHRHRLGSGEKQSAPQAPVGVPGGREVQGGGDHRGGAVCWGVFTPIWRCSAGDRVQRGDNNPSSRGARGAAEVSEGKLAQGNRPLPRAWNRCGAGRRPTSVLGSGLTRAWRGPVSQPTLNVGYSEGGGVGFVVTGDCDGDAGRYGGPSWRWKKRPCPRPVRVRSASGPRPVRVRFFEFYRAARVRSASAAVFPCRWGGSSTSQAAEEGGQVLGLFAQRGVQKTLEGEMEKGVIASRTLRIALRGSRDSRWKARLLPDANRIICAPGARARGGSHRERTPPPPCAPPGRLILRHLCCCGRGGNPRRGQPGAQNGGNFVAGATKGMPRRAASCVWCIPFVAPATKFLPSGDALLRMPTPAEHVTLCHPFHDQLLCGSCGRPAPASPLPYPSAECPEFGRCWPELAAAQEQYQAAPLQPRLVL
eukprot:gene14941-biopygen3630